MAQGNAIKRKRGQTRDALKILNRLKREALRNPEGEISKDQIRCAEIYLRKTMPDLRSTELKGEVAVNHAFCITKYGTDTKKGAD